MSAHASRYFNMDEETRDLLKARARERYRANAETHRLKRYLHCLNAGKVRCPKTETLKRHCIELRDDGTWTPMVRA